MAAMGTMAAAALRSMRDVSVGERDMGSKATCYAKLLDGEDSDYLADHLRLGAMPCSNGDMDVATQFTADNIRKFSAVAHSRKEGMVDICGEKLAPPTKPLTAHVSETIDGVETAVSFKMSKQHLTGPDGEFNCHLLATSLYMATITRYTGKVTAMNLFKSLADENMHLPEFSETLRYVDFLRQLDCANKSGQHTGMIPVALDSKEKVQRFFLALATAKAGYRRVYNFLRAQGANDKPEIERVQLISLLMECIDKCGDVQGEENMLGFMAMKIVGDVDVVFPGYVGPVTVACVVLGAGSSHGLGCVGGLYNATEAKGATKTSTKFLRFHDRLHKYLLEQEDDFLLASGWKRLVVLGVPKLFSLYSGREFGMGDTEHILCKVWLCIVYSHSSRNIAEEKTPFADHCHPLPEVQDWEALMAPCMKKIWASYVKTAQLINPPSAAKDLPKRKYRHPYCMLFPFERTGGEGERIEKILEKLGKEQFGKRKDRRVARVPDSTVEEDVSAAEEDVSTAEVVPV